MQVDAKFFVALINMEEHLMDGISFFMCFFIC